MWNTWLRPELDWLDSSLCSCLPHVFFLFSHHPLLLPDYLSLSDSYHHHWMLPGSSTFSQTNLNCNKEPGIFSDSATIIHLSSQHCLYHHPQSTQYCLLVLMDRSLLHSMSQAQARPSFMFYSLTVLTLLNTLLVHVQYDLWHCFSAMFWPLPETPISRPCFLCLKSSLSTLPFV